MDGGGQQLQERIAAATRCGSAYNAALESAEQPLG